MHKKDRYTPGYSKTASGFMTRRSADTHARFFTPCLEPNMRLLDCGCGPGSISCDFARMLSEGAVTAIDSEQTQIDLATERARDLNLNNVEFLVGSVYHLPFDDGSFDVVFSHALFEHLSDPSSALSEIYRVLAPGGLVGIRSPDWGGFLVTPMSSRVEAAISRYAAIQTDNGGDIHVGRKLPALARSAGFDDLHFSATYDCSQPPKVIGEYLADGLMASNATKDADSMLEWSSNPDALWAQSWCEIVGMKKQNKRL